MTDMDPMVMLDYNQIFPGQATRDLFSASLNWRPLYREDEAVRYVLDHNDISAALVVSGDELKLAETVSAFRKFNPLMKIAVWALPELAETLKLQRVDNLEELLSYIGTEDGFRRQYNRTEWPLQAWFSSPAVRQQASARAVDLSAGGGRFVTDNPASLKADQSLRLHIQFTDGDHTFKFYTDAVVNRVEKETVFTAKFVNVSLKTQDMIDQIINSHLYLKLLEKK